MMVTEYDWTERQQVRETERILSAQVSPSVEDACDIANFNTRPIIYPNGFTHDPQHNHPEDEYDE